MIAITVSTNYDDILDVIISQNYLFFEKWYIITDKNDTKTIDVIKKYNFSNILILFYDFFTGNKIFNKGGAIKYCQKEIIGNLNYRGNIVILDSDIWLPDNFNEIIEDIIVEDNQLYGTNKRYDYYSYENFKNNQIDFDYPWSKEFQGYFQLYKYDINKLYDDSDNCSGCDLQFLRFFTKKTILSNLNVSHLGKHGINWNKRANKNDFIIPHKMLSDPFFNSPNKDTYPPFKNGLYLEEYFSKTIKEQAPLLKRKYIPVLWTNFQIAEWFLYKKQELQIIFNEWVQQNPSEYGYFTVVQHDDGPGLILPENTMIYGACSGTIPIPLIYEDKNHTLVQVPRKTFAEKQILCSFVGNNTSKVREKMVDVLKENENMFFFHSGGWTASVNENLQQKFINITVDSKFALAPRGYGHGSFRFYECFQLGTIPIYLWDDIEWLPFQDKIDYSKLCISIPITRIDELESILLSITEEQYQERLDYYEKIKHLFELEGMSNEIIRLESFTTTV